MKTRHAVPMLLAAAVLAGCARSMAEGPRMPAAGY
jgi:hypothetical protein